MDIRLLIFGIALLLAACAPTSRPNIPIGPIEITDRKPVSFAGRQPASYPVRGMDAARFQTFVDWPRAKAAGIEFVFLKATEGGDLLDPAFELYWTGARQAGIAHAPYHFYYFCTSARVQARWFIKNVPRSALVMPPVLDIEWNHRSPTCKFRPPPEVGA